MLRLAGGETWGPFERMLCEMTSLILAAVLAPTVQKAPPALVRVINAVADRESLAFSIGDGTWENVPYGQRTRYEMIDVERALTPTVIESRKGERITNEVAIKLQPSYPHTVIFTGKVQDSGRFTPIVIRDVDSGRPVGNTVQIQFVNAMSDQQVVSIKLDDKIPARYKTLAFGTPTGMLGFAVREYTVTLSDAKGTEMFSTKFQAFSGTRYLAVAMGASGEQGNRAPRVFFYTF